MDESFRREEARAAAARLAETLAATVRPDERRAERPEAFRAEADVPLDDVDADLRVLRTVTSVHTDLKLPILTIELDDGIEMIVDTYSPFRSWRRSGGQEPWPPIAWLFPDGEVLLFPPLSYGDELSSFPPSYARHVRSLESMAKARQNQPNVRIRPIRDVPEILQRSLTDFLTTRLAFFGLGGGQRKSQTQYLGVTVSTKNPGVVVASCPVYMGSWKMFGGGHPTAAVPPHSSPFQISGHLLPGNYLFGGYPPSNTGFKQNSGVFGLPPDLNCHLNNL